MNSGHINNIRSRSTATTGRKVGNKRGDHRFGGSKGYKVTATKVLQSKQSFRVREVVDATIADRDEGHKTG